MSDHRRSRVLLLGWDGADWKIIKRLVDAGQMPNLERLLDEGVMGNLASLPPMLSPMLWTSVATGKRADKHGVHGFLEPRPDGRGIRLVSSTSIRATTLWRILTDAGLRSAVVGWYATHPAAPVGGTVVSDLVARGPGHDFESWPLPSDSVAPEALRAVAADLRVHPTEVDADQLLYFVPRAVEIDQRTDRRLGTLARLIAQCATTHAAGTYLAEREPWDLLAVYYETIDRMCHQFMPYHPPRMEHIDPEDFDRYCDVIDQCYWFHDLMLGRYMELVGAETTIVIVSDHGFHSDHLRPRAQRDAWGQPVQWHRRYGILVARGPGIKRDQLVFGASLLDVAPTILTMLGLPVGRDMEGRVLTQIFESPVTPAYVETHERVTDGGSAGDGEDDPWAAQEAIAQLVALGYVEAPPADAAKAIDQVTLEKLLNLADVHLSAREYPRAVDVLGELLTRWPGHVVASGRLAQARLELGDVEGCRELVDQLLAKQPDSHWAHLAQGLMHFRQREWDAALASFQRVEHDAPELPTLHYRMGVVHLQQERWPEAQGAFETALELDGDDAGAYDGLGLARYRQQRYEEAAEAFLRSIALLYRQPLVHFHLGVALAATGRLDAAIDSLERALEWAPDLAAAHESLAGIHRARGDADRAARHLSRAQTIRQLGTVCRRLIGSWPLRIRVLQPRTWSGEAYPPLPPPSASELWAAHLTLDRTQWLSAAEIEAGQLEQVRVVLAHAVERVPYYREVLGETGITADALRSMDDVRRVPTLSRRTRAEQLGRMRASALPDDMPDTAARRWWTLLGLRSLEWGGFDPRGVAVMIQPVDASGLLARQLLDGVSLPDWGTRFAAIETGRSHLMDSRQDPRRQLDWLIRTRPHYLMTPPSNAARLAAAALETGRQVEALRAIQTIGEPLADDVRARIRTAFGVPVTSTYSCAEAGYVASSCPGGEGWHIHEESVIVEVLGPDGTPSPAGQAGRVVLTALQDFSTPLIRYEIGDVAERRAAPCPCGRGLASLDRIEVR